MSSKVYICFLSEFHIVVSLWVQFMVFGPRYVVGLDRSMYSDAV